MMSLKYQKIIHKCFTHLKQRIYYALKTATVARGERVQRSEPPEIALNVGRQTDVNQEDTL